MAFIASLDVGTTSVRCFIFDSDCNVKGRAVELIELLSPKPGRFEIEPEKLWESVLNVIRNAAKDAKLTIEQVACLGISTQRCTFVTWHRKTNETFHNLITWKDLRADELVNEWNSGCMLRTIRGASYGLYFVTRNKRYLAAAVLKMMNSQVTLRLLYEMDHNEKLKKALSQKEALFGTLDSWLLYRFRQGLDSGNPVEHITDVTSATATGIFDPFILKWSDLAFNVFKIQPELLPTVVDNSHDLGYVHESIFGSKLKISSSVSDQTASMWGSCCFNEADMKVTLGTGAFLNLVTGANCHASIMGLYPLVAWRLKAGTAVEEVMYCVEGASNDCGTVISWAVKTGLFDDPSLSSDIALSVNDSDGVFFVPAFSGLGAPVNDFKATSGFIGIRPSTTKAHLVRALLESIAYRVVQLYHCTQIETNYKLKCIRVDGGVSKNDFICQTIADATNVQVERSTNTESSVTGAAFVAGLNANIWERKEDLCKFRKVEKVFAPVTENKAKIEERMRNWEKALGRFKEWY